MTSKKRNLLIALGVIVLLALSYPALLLYQQAQIQAEEPFWAREESFVRLGNLFAPDIFRIEVPDLTLQRVDRNTWRISSLNGQVPEEHIDIDQEKAEGISWALAGFWAERVVEEDPDDLSIYGLDQPDVQLTVTAIDGSSLVFYRGDLSPSRTAYYVMQEGDPRVFMVTVSTAEHMTITLEDLQPLYRFPYIPDFEGLSYMQLGTSLGTVEIRPMPNVLPTHLGTTFSGFILTAPYQLHRGVDSEFLQEVVESLTNLSIEQVIHDNPPSLAPYGLDNPIRLALIVAGESLALYIGNPVDGAHYAKLPFEPGVFTVRGLNRVASARPLDFLDKFILLIGIDRADAVTLGGGGFPDVSVGIQGQGNNAAFHINGRRAEDRSFRTFYQHVIGLLMDAEVPQPAPVYTAAELASEDNFFIEFQLNAPPDTTTRITLVPYNRDFYALHQEGTVEFLVSRQQVRRIFEALDQVRYLD
ncbi:MAG: DUF4340 domain-containing protein [Treponema sp.]|nr:DUF4340 domain-containing protein [Treponema sp.]